MGLVPLALPPLIADCTLELNIIFRCACDAWRVERWWDDHIKTIFDITVVVWIVDVMNRECQPYATAVLALLQLHSHLRLYRLFLQMLVVYFAMPRYGELTACWRCSRQSQENLGSIGMLLCNLSKHLRQLRNLICCCGFVT